MSSPPTRTPALVRGLSLVVVLAAIVVYLWPFGRSHAPAPAPHETASPAASAPVASAPAPAPAGWGEAVGFRSPAKLEEHFRKHGAEFRAASVEEYLRLAQALRDAPVGGEILEIVRDDGTRSRFDRATGAFLAFDPDGTIRTFFRPNDGLRYFQRQAGRPH